MCVTWIIYSFSQLVQWFTAVHGTLQWIQELEKMSECVQMDGKKCLKFRWLAALVIWSSHWGPPEFLIGRARDPQFSWKGYMEQILKLHLFGTHIIFALFVYLLVGGCLLVDIVRLHSNLQSRSVVLSLGLQQIFAPAVQVSEIASLTYLFLLCFFLAGLLFLNLFSSWGLITIHWSAQILSTQFVSTSIFSHRSTSAIKIYDIFISP